MPSGDPAPGLREHWQAPGRFWIGLGLWLAGGVLLAVTWWRTRPASLVTAAIWAVPLLLAPPLGSRDVYAYACQGALWLDGRDVYATGVADGGCPWTASVPDIWWHTPTPYGPVAVVLNGAAVAVARLLAHNTDTQLIIAVTLLRVIALGGLALIVWGMSRLPVRRFGAPGGDRAGEVSQRRGWGRDLDGSARTRWLGLITPLVAIHAVSGGHNDALVAGLIVAGLGAAYQKEWLVAGILTAAAVGVKVTAIVALPFVLLLLPSWRARWSALIAAVAAFAGLSLAAGLDLGWVRALSSTGDLKQWTSLPTGAGMAVGYLTGAASPAITVARALGLLVLATIGLYAVRRAWNAPVGTVVAACGWVLAATALLGPVFYPWYAVAPLAVLACTESGWERTRAVAVIVLTFLVLPNGLGVAVLTKGPGAFLALAAVIALACWGVRAVRARPTATA